MLKHALVVEPEVLLDVLVLGKLHARRGEQVVVDAEVQHLRIREDAVEIKNDRFHRHECTSPRLRTKITKATKITKCILFFVILVVFVAFVPERDT